MCTAIEQSLKKLWEITLLYLKVLGKIHLAYGHKGTEKL